MTWGNSHNDTVAEDFKLYENEKSDAKQILGKPKRNLHYWIIGLVMLVAAPIVIYQGIKEEKTNNTEAVSKEKERESNTAKTNQVRDTAPIKALIESQSTPPQTAAPQLPPQLQTNQPSEEQPQTTPKLLYQQPSTPLPGGMKPRNTNEKFPEVPNKIAGGSKRIDIESKNISDLTIYSSPIALLTGEKNSSKVADFADSINPGNIKPQGALGGNGANNSQGPMYSPQQQLTSTKANEKWAKDQATQQPEDTSGIYATAPPKDTVIMEGSVLTAAFLSEVTTDMPGDLSAIVTNDVYDTIFAKFLLIPKGSKLIGSYNSEITVGQERVMMAFKRLIFPNGSSIALLGMNGTDAAGINGVEGDVNNHFLKMFGSSFLIAGLTYFTQPSNNSTVNVYGGSGQSTLGTQAGQILTNVTTQIQQGNKNIQPTITISKGEKFNVRVNKDMHLPVYNF
jgi:type IV secretory pathway VirB10-like protein